MSASPARQGCRVMTRNCSSGSCGSGSRETSERIESMSPDDFTLRISGSGMTTPRAYKPRDFRDQEQL